MQSAVSRVSGEIWRNDMHRPGKVAAAMATRRDNIIPMLPMMMMMIVMMKAAIVNDYYYCAAYLP